MINFTSIELVPAYVGIAFVLSGLVLYKFPPKKINYFYGYRTPSAMRNQKNWDFSQTYSAIRLIVTGIIIASVALMSYLIKLQFFSTPFASSLLILCAVLYVIISTEWAIKKINS